MGDGRVRIVSSGADLREVADGRDRTFGANHRACQRLVEQTAGLGCTLNSSTPGSEPCVALDPGRRESPDLNRFVRVPLQSPWSALRIPETWSRVCKHTSDVRRFRKISPTRNCNWLILWSCLIVDFGMDPQRARDALRFFVDLTGDGEVGLDVGVSRDLAQALEARGHRIRAPDGDERSFFEGGRIISRDSQSGALVTGSGPRSDGAAAGRQEWKRCTSRAAPCAAVGARRRV